MNKSLLKMTLVITACLSFNLMANDEIPSSPQIDSEQMPSHQQQTVNINQADSDSLSTLKGIGKQKAQAIISYRQENGAFTDVNDLLNVKGIGLKVIQDNITRLKI